MGCLNRLKNRYFMVKTKVRKQAIPATKVKQVSKVERLVDAAEADRKIRKAAAKERRLERKALHKNLLRGSSSNRSYVATIPGAKINVRWLNGVQQVSVDYTGTTAKGTEEVEEVVVNLPSEKMTWKKLRAEVVAGNSVYNKAGKSIPCTVRAEATPNKEVKVTVENLGKTKIYRLL